MKEADAGGALDVASDGIDRVSGLGGADDTLGQAGLNLVVFSRRWLPGLARSRLWLFRGVLLFPIRAESLGPMSKFSRDGGCAAVDFIDELDDFFTVGQGESVAARGAFRRGFGRRSP